MVRSFQLDADLVRPGRQAVQNHRLSLASARPRRIIDIHMDVSDPGRDGERGRPKTGTMWRFSCDTELPRGHARGGRQRRINDELRGGSFCSGSTAAAPRTSRAVCAAAEATIRPAMMAPRIRCGYEVSCRW